MLRFSDLSIRHKVQSLIVTTASAALLVAAGALCLYDWRAWKESLSSDALALTRVMGLNSLSALVFRDGEAATSNLSSLAAQRHVRCAFLFTDDGALLASYAREASEDSCSPAQSAREEFVAYGDDELRIRHGVRMSAKEVGTIELVADLTVLYDRLRNYALAAIAIATLTVVIVLGASVWLQRLISDPILALAQVVGRISAHNDYSLRASPRGADEIGTLIEGFNKMVSEIERRDYVLRESEERTRNIIESAAQGIIVTDDMGIVQGVNVAAEKMFERLRSEIKDQAIDTLLAAPNDEPDAVVEGIRNGTRFPVEVSVSEAKAGEHRLYTYIVRDLTEQRATERERARLETQLRQAQKMEAIGVLAGGIAHDFNNILTAIIGHTQLAAKHLPPESRSHGNLGRVLQAGMRAKDLVKQLLTFSRQTEVNYSAIDLTTVVEESSAFLKASVPAMIQIDTHIEEGAHTVVADPTQMQQIVMNLGTNAYHAIGDKPGHIDISLRNLRIDTPLAVHGGTLRPASYVELSVRDDGKGMDAEIQARIFEPFFTTKAVNEGTGMGLAVVHGIVSGQKGGISLESRVGDGSNFRIYLPAAGRAADAADLETAPAEHGSGRVLLVDDEEAVAEMATEVLSDLGYTVTAFHDSAEALGVFRARPRDFDLVITDQSMPKLTGVELARAILAVRPELPVIVSSGYSKDVRPSQARELGFTAYVSKPYKHEQLAKAVKEALDSRQET